MTPFHKAAEAESLEVIQYMEVQGADINKLTGDGCNVLRKSSSRGKMQKGIQSTNSVMMLDLAARGDSTAILRYLLRSSQLVHSLSSRSTDGRTALHCAVEAGSLDTARFILERSNSEDILSKSHDGHSCLHYAVYLIAPRCLDCFKIPESVTTSRLINPVTPLFTGSCIVTHDYGKPYLIISTELPYYHRIPLPIRHNGRMLEYPRSARRLDG